MLDIKGSIVALVTPMNEDGSVNYDKLGELFISSFGDKIGLFINALLNTTVIDLVNNLINNYLGIFIYLRVSTVSRIDNFCFIR